MTPTVVGRIRQLAKAKPTVVFVGYGMASSFAGEEGLQKFEQDLDRLMRTIQNEATNQVRFVVLSPLRHYQMPAPLPLIVSPGRVGELKG